MNAILKKPYLLFFWLIPFFLLLSFLVKGNVLSIRMYETYFTISCTYLCYLSMGFFGLIGLNYYLLHWAHKHPKRTLVIAHVFLQIICLLYFIYALFAIATEDTMLRDPFISDISENMILVISFMVFLIATIIHFINFLISLLSKR